MLLLWLLWVALRPVAPDAQWVPPGPLDQRGQNSCLPAALLDWLGTTPAPVPRWALPSLPGLYAQVQRLDGDPDWHDATTLRSGWRALEVDGLIWPGSAQVTRDRRIAAGWLSTGPVALLTPWYASMFINPQAGAVRVDPASGGTAWHTVLIWGRQGDRWLALNSWGADWGDRGRFTLRTADLDVLLAHGAQFTRAQKRPQGRD